MDKMTEPNFIKIALEEEKNIREKMKDFGETSLIKKLNKLIGRIGATPGMDVLLPPVGMPYYRVEALSKGGWRGVFSKTKTLSEEVEKLITKLGRHSPVPGTEFKTLSWKNPNLRFAYSEKAIYPELAKELKAMATKYPKELRLIELPESVAAKAAYSDPTQIAVPIRQIFKYKPKR